MAFNCNKTIGVSASGPDLADARS